MSYSYHLNKPHSGYKHTLTKANQLEVENIEKIRTAS